MIPTCLVERGRSPLHKSSQQLYTYSLLASPLPFHRSRHNAPVRPASRRLQQRSAHSRVPFGWTGLHDEPETQAPKPQRATADRLRLATKAALKAAPPGAGLTAGPLLPRDHGRLGSLGYYQAALKALLEALRRGDVFQMYLSLMKLVRENGTEAGAWTFAEVVANIPPTTFSEILRSFDPHSVAREIDSAPGLNISYGVALHTPLGELVNKWGVKTLYIRILRRLLRIQDARREKHIIPLLNDYVVLMRCAGAISDTRAAKDVWHSMRGDGREKIRHAEAFAEFIKARYLTEKIYANNDLARLRLRPLDMHRSSMRLPWPDRKRLIHLASHLTDRRKHRFGANMHERYFDESLTRVLRKRNPLLKIERTARLRGMFFGHEELVCALLKANGRTGRLLANDSLLKHHWGILLQRDKTTGDIEVHGGLTFPPDSPRTPTAALIDAIVHGYCSMGEIATAIKLVEFISQRYDIPIPDHTWSALIEYTRIMQTKPAANEWAIARFYQKARKADDVLDVWSLCTQEPHAFQPGARDYYNLIKSLIRKSGSMQRPIDALRQIKPLYDDIVDACEQAYFELVHTTQQAVPNHAAYRRYRALEARRNYMWYMFHYSILQILKLVRPSRVDDNCSVREIPKLLGDFAQFLPRRISYDVATGSLEFSSDAARRSSIVGGREFLMQPRRAMEMRIVEKPAYLWRPRFSGPPDQSSMLSIRRGGGEFTGFHNNPLRKHFAAYKTVLVTKRVIGVPVDLPGIRERNDMKMVQELLKIRR